MKQFKFLSVLVFSITLVSCHSQSKSKTTETNASISKIEVIDFHSTHRCITCKAIEANTKYTLETYFSKEIKDGEITFQVINVDDKKNEKIAESFEASGTALFLNVVNDGKEKHIDLTEFAFINGNEKEAFANALRLKIANALKTL